MGHSKETVALMVYISVDPEEAASALAQLEERYIRSGSHAADGCGDGSFESRMEALGMFGLNDTRSGDASWTG